MTNAITLTPRRSLPPGLELDPLDPGRFGETASREISSIPLWCGRETIPLGDLFTVSGERSTEVRIEGSLDSVAAVGAGMTAGTIVVAGDVGARAGAGMRGGRLVIQGSARDDAGAGMSGGALRIMGHVGARLGGGQPGAARGMQGGEIVVSGNAGAEVGARMRRGLIVVGGSSGAELGRDMIAGTIVVGGLLGSGAGPRNKRGSIVACGGGAVPPTYRFACTYEPAFLRVLFVYLRRLECIDVPSRWIEGHYRRYCGDAALPGRGEILELVS